MEKPVRAPLSTVQDAYGRRAHEYASLLGTVESLAAADVALVSEWALGIEGPVLDVGCGPWDLRDALHELHRVIAPGGGLAVGFFEGPDLVPFEHAVTTAFFWPMDRLVGEIQGAGFTVTRTEARTDPGSRRHGAILARRG